MTGYWIVWCATVRTRGGDVDRYLDRGLAMLRNHAFVVGADYEHDPDRGTVVFGVAVEHSATRVVAIHRASRAIRESLQRGGLGVPHGRPYAPPPVVRVELEPWPKSVRDLGDVAPQGRGR